MKKLLELLSEINYWEATPDFELGFMRKRYSDALWNLLGNQLVKVIVGQRRSGKSYVVRQLIDRLINERRVDGKNIFYLNKEMFEFETIKDAKDLSEIIHLYETAYLPKGKVYIFIDEVQNISDWEKVIVSLAQHPIKEYEVFVTGSNSKLLSGELASLLSGRYILLEVFPFSYREFLDYRNMNNKKESFIDYVTTSALPEIFHLDAEETKRNYFQSLKNTILLKDIMYRHNIRDYVLLEDIFLFLLHNVGNLTSVPAILKYFKSKNRKTDYKTISQYISYMKETYLIHESPRFSLKTKEILSGEKKYFINDMGFRNYLFSHLIKDIGVILENTVYMHLRMAGYEIRIGYEQNSEVDFFATKFREKQYIQVAYVLPTKETIDREFGSLEKIKDNLPKYVLTMDDMLIDNDKGIVHQHVWDYIFNLV